MTLTRHEHNLYRVEPTEEDVKKAKALIASHEDSISVLNGRISELYTQIRRIEEHKKAHLAEIIKSRGVLTMARRMPGELLARIFEECIAEGWTRAPVVVSQVCSTWREAAMDPRVWSHVYIDCDKGNPLSRCSLWLSKSLQCPLVVTLRASEHHARVDSVLDMLVSQIGRWTTFTLEVPTVRLANYVFSWITGESALILKNVHVHLTEDAQGDHPVNLVVEQQGRLDGLLTAFSSAPCLDNLYLHTDSERSWVGMPGIKHLSLSLNECRVSGAPPISEPNILDVLSDCPGLLSCSILIPRSDSRSIELDQPARVVTMQNLEELTLILPSSWMLLTHHLRTPTLERLHLRCPDDPHGYAADVIRYALRNFFEFSLPPLRLLDMYDIDVSQEDFEVIFTQLDRLEDLRLHGSEILDSTISKLSAPVNLLPRLRRLDLRWCGHVTGTELADLVEARANSGGDTSSLEELTIINCSFVKEQDIMRIARHATCRLLTRSDDYCSKCSLASYHYMYNE